MVLTEVHTQLGGGDRRETVRRAGVLQVRAAPRVGEIAIEAWYDTLAVSREAPEGTLVPDTDGLLGGRYRGHLTPAGQYRAEATPFVPDEVLEVTDLRRALDDFFPRSPEAALAVGEQASAADGARFERLPDSAAAGGAWVGVRLIRRREGTTPLAQGEQDGIRTEEEEATAWWESGSGPRAWHRRIVVETSIAPGPVVRQAVRLRVEQHIAVERLASCGPVE